MPAAAGPVDAMPRRTWPAGFPSRNTDGPHLPDMQILRGPCNFGSVPLLSTDDAGISPTWCLAPERLAVSLPWQRRRRCAGSHIARIRPPRQTVAARTGSAEFFAPLILYSPRRGTPAVYVMYLSNQNTPPDSIDYSMRKVYPECMLKW